MIRFLENAVCNSAELDEDTLQQVAETTGGKYFRATDAESLAQIYTAIEQLEKSQLQVQQYKEYVELFLPWLTRRSVCCVLKLC